MPKCAICGNDRGSGHFICKECLMKGDNMSLEYRDFEDFLMERCMLENPMVLDDDSHDFFDDWIVNLEVDDWLKYGDMYAKTKRGVK